MLSFCRSFKEVDKWVAPALSKITSALSVALKLKPLMSAKALAWLSLTAKESVPGPAVMFEAEIALSKVVRSAKLALALTPLTAKPSMLI